MLKAKVTDRQLREGYYTIEVGYCDAQNILRFANARFYNYGVYGWRYDVYELDWDLAICTGYQPVRSIPKKGKYKGGRNHREVRQESRDNQKQSVQELCQLQKGNRTPLQ